MKVSTNVLQTMVSRVIKGAGNNKLIPITSLMGISLTNGVLTLETTDQSNYTYVSEEVEGEDFYVAVPIDLFSKLIARLTCDYVELDIAQGNLEIKGNGTYYLELPIDTDGAVVKFPNPFPSDYEGWEHTTIALSTIKRIISAVKPALATSMDMPCYTNYYVGDVVMATDSFKITSLDEKLFSEPKLVSAKMMDLLDIITEDNIDCYIKDDKVSFVTKGCSIYGSFMQGIEKYAITAIKALFDKTYNSKCFLSKVEVLQLLDRISLFVSAFDDNGIVLDFGEEGVTISSSQTSGSEVINYISTENLTPTSIRIDIEMLRAQVKAQDRDDIEMYFGDEGNQTIMLIDDKLTSIIALIQ